jgi:hypothetical protein
VGLNTTPISTKTRKTRCKIIHDIYPIQERLYKINLKMTDNSTHCGNVDTVRHLMTGCTRIKNTWEWTRERIAKLLNAVRRWISTDWTTSPDMKIEPKGRHNFILWMEAYMNHFIMDNERVMTLEEYLDFFRKSRWKIESQKKNRKTNRMLY